MGEFEAVGDAVTGGLLARAVEPEAGDTGHTHEGACLNCGTKLVGPFCAVCGQKSHVHRSLRGFFQDFVAGLFNFEGKFWRTLPMLAWHPGELTRRYIAGERARFISPVALYLFTVFLMFAVLNLTGALDSGTGGAIGPNLERAATEQKAEIARLEKRRADALAANKSADQLDRRIANEKKDLDQLQKLRRGEIAIEGDMDPNSPRWIRNAVKKAQANPELVVTNVQDAASKFSWLLIPLSVPFLWLLFPFRRRHNLYDHTVFVTYSLSFMMMLVITAGLLVAGGMTAIAGFLFFVPPFHMYRQLKEAYQLGRFGTWWRTILLTTFAFIAGGLFFVVVAAVGMA
jgi:uncharacterized protein DUF3667